MQQPPPDVEVYEIALTRCWWGADGILYSVSKPGDRNFENYGELFELYAKLSEEGTKKFCVLGDITETTPLSREVREFVSEGTAKYVKAMALVSSSTMGTATGSIYEMLSKTPYLVATFQHREDAVKWLQQIMIMGPSSFDSTT